MRIVRPLLIGVIFSFVAASATFAQSAIAGLVRDSSGAVLPGVTVEVASPALIGGTRSAETRNASSRCAEPCSSHPTRM